MFTHAIVRTPGPDFAAGLTTVDLGKPSFEVLLRQHSAYVDALRAVGLEVTALEPLPGLPDAYFVEDVAVLTPGLAVITRPGAAERRPEAAAMAATLGDLHPLAFIEAPGTLDGGDVLTVDHDVFVGLSARTNPAGAAQLARFIEPQGFRVTTLAVPTGLHLKTSVTALDREKLLISGSFSRFPEFAKFDRVVVDTVEHAAANALAVNGTVLLPAGAPKTVARLRTLGLNVVALELSEVQKMDGGLTCLSLRW